MTEEKRMTPEQMMDDSDTDYCSWTIKECKQVQEFLRSQAREIENLHTVMMAAAVEITEHWDAHCDSDGYGPVNLVRRLENGFPEQYGYDAQTLVRMDTRLEDQAAEIERLKSAALVARGALLFLGHSAGSEVVQAIDAALKENQHD